ncbi:MAG: prepilin-type N-terminal cleavage/methylation domain-containing protein [Gammaproteobacteria bacterium]|nr:MAG: prepilin-type N-terminal cleavage/methylation domain-containing protein [Gammaproteobacteria bacterium]
MQLRSATRSSGPAMGFTLIELMVVVAIVTILFSIAIPSYMSYIRQSRRTEAKTAVLDLAGREERFLSTNPTAYTDVPANLGYTGFGAGNPVGSGYYYLTVCSPATVACAPNPPATPSYSIMATPVATQSQANDAQCTSFSVDSTGQQFATGTGGTAYCWGN